jgi:hypothetical protein
MPSEKPTLYTEDELKILDQFVIAVMIGEGPPKVFVGKLETERSLANYTKKCYMIAQEMYKARCELSVAHKIENDKSV